MLTFLALWGLRSFAEINLFLGAPCAATDMLPTRLRYLARYFRGDRISPAFPLTVNCLVAVLVVLIDRSLTHPEPLASTSAGLLAALVATGIAEMFFLMFPFHEDKLWRWTQSDRSEPQPPASAAAGLSHDDRRTTRLRGKRVGKPTAHGRGGG